jgi:hypothetical protein
MKFPLWYYKTISGARTPEDLLILNRTVCGRRDALRGIEIRPYTGKEPAGKRRCAIGNTQGHYRAQVPHGHVC